MNEERYTMINTSLKKREVAIFISDSADFKIRKVSGIKRGII